MLACLFALLLAGCSRTVKSELAEAARAYNDGNLSRAIELYGRITHKHKDSGEAFYGLGISRLADHDLAGAEVALTHATGLLKGTGEQTEAYIQLSDVYLQLHRSDRMYMDAAQRMADLVLARDPNSFDGHRLWAVLAHVRGAELSKTDPATARAWYEKSISESRRADSARPNQPAVLSGLAAALEETGRAAEAEQAYWKLVGIEPAASDPYFHLLTIEQQRGETAEAVTTARSAIESHPADFDFLISMANHGLRLDREDLFELFANRMASVAGRSKLTRLRLGRLYESAGMMDKALEQYRLGESGEASERLACREAAVSLLIKVHRLPEAEAGLKGLEQGEAASEDVKVLRASLLTEQNMAAKAVPLLEMLLSHNPKNVKATYQLARAYRQMGREEMAAYMFDRCDHLSPGFTPALVERADIYLSRGDRIWAKSLAARVLNVEPANPEARRIEHACLQDGDGKRSH